MEPYYVVAPKMARAQGYKTFYGRNLLIFIQTQTVCYNMLKKLVRDKRSSSIRNFVNYGRKKFYNIGLGK
jgi:hypothetical protein